MIKRLFSKRSGFTLVEIIVAFAVFAIMSTMIVQILNIIAIQRRSNNEFARDIDAQEGYIIGYGKEKFDGEEDGEVKLEFNDGTEFGFKYQSFNAYGEKDLDGLSYFVSAQGERTNVGDGDTGAGDENLDNTGAVTDRFDVRITGTKGFDYVSVDKVIKVNEYTDENGKKVTVYAFEFSANAGSSMNTSDIPYANYRIIFYDKNGNQAEIVYANYINADFSSAEDWAGLGSGAKSPISSSTGAVSSSPSSSNKYTVSITSRNGIRIGSPFKSSGGGGGGEPKFICTRCGALFENSWTWSPCPNGDNAWDSCSNHLTDYTPPPAPVDPDDTYNGNGVKFKGTNSTRVEVAFYGDPQLTVASFGATGTAYGSSYRYTANTSVGGTLTGPNIYGAYAKS